MRRWFYISIAAYLLVACQRADMAYLEETLYVRNDGADMPAYVFGNGESKTFIAILHGGPGGNGLEYRAGTYAEQLEERYAMVYWDQRGQGMAQGTYGSQDMNMNQMVDDVRALLHTLRTHYGDDIRIFLFGHSWGGTLGTKFMIDTANQALVDGWIEADGAHDIPRLNIEAVKLFRQVAAEQIAAGNSTDKWTEILEWANGLDTNNLGLDEGGEINQRGYEAEDLLAQDGLLDMGDYSFTTPLDPTNALTSFLSGNYTNGLLEEENEATALTDSLHQITVPCLFLWGQYDFVVPPQLGVDAYNRVSSTDKELVIFTRSGHSPMDNESDLFTAEMIEFIERN